MYVINLEWKDSNPDIAEVAKRHPSKYVNMAVQGSVTLIRSSFQVSEDIAFNLESSFEDAASLLPGNIGGALQTASNLFRGLSGTAPDFFNFFKLQVWSDTKPVSFNFKFMFHTRTDGWGDVWVPAMSLASNSILKQIGEGESDNFRTPGVSLSNLASVRVARLEERRANSNQNNSNQSSGSSSGAGAASANGPAPLDANRLKNGNIVRIHIPGLFSSPAMYLEKTNLTVSKETTISGAPLWIEADTTISGMFPAYDRGITAEGNAASKLGSGLADTLIGRARNLFT